MNRNPVRMWRTAALALAALSATSLLATPGAFAADAPVDRELERFWNPYFDYPTRENPLNENAGKFEASVNVGVLPNDFFYMGFPINVRLDYHMTDDLALELSVSYVLTNNSDLHDFLECPTGGTTCPNYLDRVNKPTRPFLLTALDLAYAPFHGKLGIFDKKIASFDLGLLVGAGLIGAEVDESQGLASPERVFKPAGHWGAGFRFFFTETVGMRIDYRHFVYKPQDDVILPVELTLGATFML